MERSSAPLRSHRVVLTHDLANFNICRLSQIGQVPKSLMQQLNRVFSLLVKEAFERWPAGTGQICRVVLSYFFGT